MMHAFTVLAVLSFVASALAYQVTNPSNTANWTTAGPNTFTWTRVSTDATNFTLVLTNQDRSVMPTNNLVLVPTVDGTQDGTLSVTSPAGGLPAGAAFQLNLVKDADDLTEILAQSDQFNITQSPASASSSASASKSSSTSPSKSSSSSSSPSATHSSAAYALDVRSGAAGAFAFLGAAVALL